MKSEVSSQKIQKGNIGVYASDDDNLDATLNFEGTHSRNTINNLGFWNGEKLEEKQEVSKS